MKNDEVNLFMNGLRYRIKITEPKKRRLNPWLIFMLATIIVAGALMLAHAEPTEGRATWYSVASCLKESGQYRMANGHLLDDSALTCASWFYKFGTKLRVYSEETGKAVIVTVTDRGPSRRLVERGKIIDLSMAAFRRLGVPLSYGVVHVTVEILERG